MTESTKKAYLARLTAQQRRIGGDIIVAELLEELACEINRLEAGGDYPRT